MRTDIVFRKLELLRRCWPCRVLRLTAVPCVQNTKQMLWDLLGAIHRKMEALCIPVSAQSLQEALSEMRSPRRSMLAVATLINDLLTECPCPVLLLIGNHGALLCPRAY